MFLSREERGLSPAKSRWRPEYRRSVFVDISENDPSASFHVANGDVYEYRGWNDSSDSEVIDITIGALTEENLDTLNRLLYEADIRSGRPLAFKTDWPQLISWRATVELPEDLAQLNPEPAEEIRHWQSFLSLLDYQVELTGLWDDRTAEASRKVETQFGLPIGGPLGDQAVGWCDGVLAVVHAEPPEPEPEPEPSPYGFRGVLRLNDYGPAVGLLKLALKDVGFKPGGFPDSYDDFDGVTVKAVRRFQLDVGLPVNGVVDYATWTALFDRLESECVTTT